MSDPADSVKNKDIVRLIAKELGRGDAQRDDWYSWSANQLSHALIGTVLAGTTMLFGAPPWTAAGLTALIYALFKELPDWIRAPGWAAARDSVQDALFVSGGSILAVGLSEKAITIYAVALIAMLAGLATGAFQRAKRSALR